MLHQQRNGSTDGPSNIGYLKLDPYQGPYLRQLVGSTQLRVTPREILRSLLTDLKYRQCVQVPVERQVPSAALMQRIGWSNDYCSHREGLAQVLRPAWPLAPIKIESAICPSRWI